MAEKQKITTFLWFDNNAEEALEFYTSIFKNSKLVSASRYGEAGPGPKGSMMVGAFELEGQRFLALNGGPRFMQARDGSHAADGEVGHRAAQGGACQTLARPLGQALSDGRPASVCVSRASSGPHYRRNSGEIRLGNHNDSLGQTMTKPSTISIGISMSPVSLMASRMRMPATEHAIIRHKP
jgi:3-demethylubiquinone-9 3-methyltransferase